MKTLKARIALLQSTSKPLGIPLLKFLLKLTLVLSTFIGISVFILSKSSHYHLYKNIIIQKFFPYDFTKLQSGLVILTQEDESYDFEAIEKPFSFTVHSLNNLTKEEAEVRLLNSLPPSLQELAKDFIKPILIFSEYYSIDPFWVTSIMWTESHFKPGARSYRGANGLMQVMPATHKYVYKKHRSQGKYLFVEQDEFSLANFFAGIDEGLEKSYVLKLVNIEIGIIYLNDLLRRFNYDYRLATVSYNMGPTWVVRRLRSNQEVGVRNIYLNKVMRSYNYITKRFNQYERVASTSI